MLPPHPRVIKGIWIDDAPWFQYLSEERVGTTYVPTDGWIVDLRQGTVTDIMTLTPAERAQTFATVKLLLSTYWTRREAAEISPDGRYSAGGGFILEAFAPNVGQVKRQFYTSQGTEGCQFGWKPDSSGIYFIEQGLSVGADQPGSMRFLPVNP